MRSFHIDIHYATFGLISKNDIVVDVAPICNWMRGKSLQEIKPFPNQKRAVVEEIKNN